MHKVLTPQSPPSTTNNNNNIQPSNEMESEIDRVLRESGITDKKKMSDLEASQLRQMDPEEVPFFGAKMN